MLIKHYEEKINYSVKGWQKQMLNKPSLFEHLKKDS